jgi:kinase-associated protein B
MEMEVGETVMASYKSGRYIGKVVELKPKLQKAVFEVRAVLVHPRQGDLHSPNKTENVFFHERKALAFTEKALVPITSMKPYDGDIPSYKDSLLESVDRQLDSLTQDDSVFSKLAIERLLALKGEYAQLKD